MIRDIVTEKVFLIFWGVLTCLVSLPGFTKDKDITCLFIKIVSFLLFLVGLGMVIGNSIYLITH